MSPRHLRPRYAEKTRVTCPRCDSERIVALPANNPGSDQAWFRCAACDHMWSQRRDRTRIIIASASDRPDSVARPLITRPSLLADEATHNVVVELGAHAHATSLELSKTAAEAERKVR